MIVRERDKRIYRLQEILERVLQVYSLANDKGITSIQFSNIKDKEENIRAKELIGDLLKRYHLSYPACLGTELKEKVLDRLVHHDMSRPLLVLVITDGNVRTMD
jgi:hypothetical protein